MQLNSTTTSCKVAFHQFFIGLGPPVCWCSIGTLGQETERESKDCWCCAGEKNGQFNSSREFIEIGARLSLDALLLRQLQARRALDVMNRSVAAFPFCFVAIIPTWRISSLDSTTAAALKSTSRFCNQGAILVLEYIYISAAFHYCTTTVLRELDLWQGPHVTSKMKELSIGSFGMMLVSKLN